MPELAVQSKPETLCVVRLSAIGDTCHALAVIRRLQDNWPDTRITWIIGKTEAALMSGVAGVELVVFDKSRGWRAYRDVRSELGGRYFDVALCMHASLRANLLYRLIPAKIRLGFDKARARDFQWLFTNRRIIAARAEHALEAMMSFATAIGATPRELRWDIPLPESASTFASRHTEPHQPLVVISPCSSQRSRNYRNWPIANYAAIIAHLEERHACKIVLTGGNSRLEQEYATALSHERAPGRSEPRRPHIAKGAARATGGRRRGDMPGFGACAHGERRAHTRHRFVRNLQSRAHRPVFLPQAVRQSLPRCGEKIPRQGVRHATLGPTGAPSRRHGLDHDRRR